MPLPPPFPIHVEQLTPRFLSDALGVEVQDLATTRIGADRGMLGEIFLVDYTSPTGSQQLVAKFAALREESLASAKRGRNYERELLCYEELLAETPVQAPACRGTWYDDQTAHFLLLQDHVASDGDVDQVEGITVKQAELVVREMAALHAHWWGRSDLSSLDWLPRLDGKLRIANLTTLAGIGWQPLNEMMGEDMPVLPANFGQDLPNRLETALRAIALLPSTLLHCDLRADNLLFDHRGTQVTIIDWQGCGAGPAAFDLAYFLVQSLSIDDRRAHEEQLKELWVRELRSRGIDTTQERALAGYAESLWYGMAIACALPVISDPAEERVRRLTSVVTRRTLAALTDAGQIYSAQ